MKTALQNKSVEIKKYTHTIENSFIVSIAPRNIVYCGEIF